MFFSRHKTKMVEPAEALPGREQPASRSREARRVRHLDAAARSPRVSRPPSSASAASGAPSASSGRRRRLHDGRRLRGRLHTEPDLRGGLLRPHRAHRGRARRLRPRRDLLRGDCSASSGRPTTRRRACARATTSARSTARRSTPHADEQRAAAEGLARDAYQKPLSESGYGRSPPRSPPPGPFYYAEAYHQQYLHKNPNGYCGLGGTGVTCPVGIASRAARAGRAAARRDLRRSTPRAGRGGARASPPAWRS